MSKQLIKFSLTDGWVDLPAPMPADKFLPEWYKKQDSYVPETGNKKIPILQGISGTIKRCVPVFDSLTAGYMLVTPCDIWVENKDGVNSYTWSIEPLIDFHPRGQAENFPTSQQAIPKINNPWLVITPKGYSTLFIQPVNRINDIQIVSGFVDTDMYYRQVHFPFTLREGFEGLIPAGTPYVQAVPIKRDTWEHNFEATDTERMKGQHDRMVSVFFDRYRRFWWDRKDFS